MKELTQMKNHLYVSFVTRNLVSHKREMNMKGFTQVKNLIGVIFVTRNFISSNQGRVMKEKTFM